MTSSPPGVGSLAIVISKRNASTADDRPTVPGREMCSIIAAVSDAVVQVHIRRGVGRDSQQQRHRDTTVAPVYPAAQQRH